MNNISSCCSDIGVYGSVFRGPYTTVRLHVLGLCLIADGEWISTIIDDNLYISANDWNQPSGERCVLENGDLRDPEQEYRRNHQTGWNALWGPRYAGLELTVMARKS